MEAKTIKVYETIKDADPLVIHNVTAYIEDNGTLIVQRSGTVLYFASWAWARYDVVDSMGGPEEG